jgi:uncharacterized membrane protein
MDTPKKTWPYFHPIPVHFPQAFFPGALGSFLLFLVTGGTLFEEGAYVMAIFGLLSLPVTALTGYLDWKIRYKGYMTPVFKIKMIGALVLSLLAAAAVLLRYSHPLQLPLDGAGWLYLVLLTACTATCTLIGHYGGKLVFH